MVRALFGGDLLAAGSMDHVVSLDTDEANVTEVVDRQALVIVGLAVLAGVAAALGPARRASRLDMLAAIATT